MGPQERSDSELANSIMPAGVEQLSRLRRLTCPCESELRFLVLEKVGRIARRYLIARKDVGFAFYSLFVVYH
ncbi:MAG: hypothetical protein ACI8XU_002142 [Kiritimatiellia bacterium]|jgi:hypothetical protein